MKTKPLSLFVASMVALLFAAVSLDANAGFAAIFGTVKDKETQQRIAGARLELNIHTTAIVQYSRADGVFLISTPNGDGYSLRISAEGYKDWVLGNIELANNAQMFIKPFLEPLPPPPQMVFSRFKQLSYSSTPYRLTRLSPFQSRSAPASPELMLPKIWALPSEENQFIAQIEIRGSGLDAIEELGVYDEAGELVPDVKIDISKASPESIVIEYQLRDRSSANLVRSIQLRAAEETFTVPMRHDFY